TAAVAAGVDCGKTYSHGAACPPRRVSHHCRRWRRVLLNVYSNRDRRRMEDMLMMRIHDPTREKVPFTGFHFAQRRKLWHSLGIKTRCEKLCGIELVHHVFRCGVEVRRVVNHGTLTALEAVFACCFGLIDCHFGFRPEYTSDGEYLRFGGPLEREDICVLGLDAS